MTSRQHEPFLFLYVACLVACHPPPTPVTPDASDASAFGDSTPQADASSVPIPAAPQACVDSCTAILAAGCVQRCPANVAVCDAPTEIAACAAALNAVEKGRLKIDPSITAPGLDNTVKCATFATVKTAADVKVHGWSCGP